VTENRNRQWRILAIALTGSFMVVLDTTIAAGIATLLVGAHFPELEFGQLRTGHWYSQAG